MNQKSNCQQFQQLNPQQQLSPSHQPPAASNTVKNSSSPSTASSPSSLSSSLSLASASSLLPLDQAFHHQVAETSQVNNLPNQHSISFSNKCQPKLNHHNAGDGQQQLVTNFSMINGNTNSPSPGASASSFPVISASSSFLVVGNSSSPSLILSSLASPTSPLLLTDFPSSGSTSPTTGSFHVGVTRGGSFVSPSAKATTTTSIKSSGLTVAGFGDFIQSHTTSSIDNVGKVAQNQQSKCLNEKRRREQENGYIEELAELISAKLSSMNSLSVKPDKCAILQETVKQVRLSKESTGPISASTSTSSTVASSSGSDDVQASEVSSSKPTVLASEVLGPLLLEALDGFLFVVNQEGKIEFVSENVHSFLNYKQSELTGDTIYNYLAVGDHARFSSNLLPMSAIGSTSTSGVSSNSTISKSRTFNCRFRIKGNKKPDRTESKDTANFKSHLTGGSSSSSSTTTTSSSTIVPLSQAVCEKGDESTSHISPKCTSDEDGFFGTLDCIGHGGSNSFMMDGTFVGSSLSIASSSNSPSNSEVYENMQISAVLMPFCKSSNSASSSSSPSELDMDSASSSSSGESDINLVCVARRIPLSDRTPSNIQVEQFSTRLDMLGKIMTIDTSGVSSTYSQHLNKDLIGKGLLELCHPADLQKLQSHLQKAMRGTYVTSPLYRLMVAQNHYVCVQTKSKLFSGTVCGQAEQCIMAAHSIIRDSESTTTSISIPNTTTATANVNTNTNSGSHTNSSSSNNNNHATRNLGPQQALMPPASVSTSGQSVTSHAATLHTPSSNVNTPALGSQHQPQHQQQQHQQQHQQQQQQQQRQQPPSSQSLLHHATTSHCHPHDSQVVSSASSSTEPVTTTGTTSSSSALILLPSGATSDTNTCSNFEASASAFTSSLSPSSNVVDTDLLSDCLGLSDMFPSSSWTEFGDSSSGVMDDARPSLMDTDEIISRPEGGQGEKRNSVNAPAAIPQRSHSSLLDSADEPGGERTLMSPPSMSSYPGSSSSTTNNSTFTNPSTSENASVTSNTNSNTIGLRRPSRTGTPSSTTASPRAVTPFGSQPQQQHQPPQQQQQQHQQQQHPATSVTSNNGNNGDRQAPNSTHTNVQKSLPTQQATLNTSTTQAQVSTSVVTASNLPVSSTAASSSSPASPSVASSSSSAITPSTLTSLTSIANDVNINTQSSLSSTSPSNSNNGNNSSTLKLRNLLTQGTGASSTNIGNSGTGDVTGISGSEEVSTDTSSSNSATSAIAIATSRSTGTVLPVTSESSSNISQSHDILRDLLNEEDEDHDIHDENSAKRDAMRRDSSNIHGNVPIGCCESMSMDAESVFASASTPSSATCCDSLYSFDRTLPSSSSAPTSSQCVTTTYTPANSGTCPTSSTSSSSEGASCILLFSQCASSSTSSGVYSTATLRDSNNGTSLVESSATPTSSNQNILTTVSSYGGTLASSSTSSSVTLQSAMAPAASTATATSSNNSNSGNNNISTNSNNNNNNNNCNNMLRKLLNPPPSSHNEDRKSSHPDILQQLLKDESSSAHDVHSYPSTPASNHPTSLNDLMSPQSVPASGSIPSSGPTFRGSSVPPYSGPSSVKRKSIDDTGSTCGSQPATPLPGTGSFTSTSASGGTCSSTGESFVKRPATCTPSNPNTPIPGNSGPAPKAQQLANQNPMLASMLAANTPKTLPATPPIPTAMLSQVPQERLPKNLEKKLVHTPASEAAAAAAAGLVTSNTNVTGINVTTTGHPGQQGPAQPQFMVMSGQMHQLSQAQVGQGHISPAMRPGGGTTGQPGISGTGAMPPVGPVTQHRIQMQAQVEGQLQAAQAQQGQGFLNKILSNDGPRPSAMSATSVPGQSMYPPPPQPQQPPSSSLMMQSPSSSSHPSTTGIMMTASSAQTIKASSSPSPSPVSSSLQVNSGVFGDPDGHSDPMLSDILDQVWSLQQEIGESVSQVVTPSSHSLPPPAPSSTSPPDEAFLKILDEVLEPTAPNIATPSTPIESVAPTDMNAKMAISAIQQQLMSVETTTRTVVTSHHAPASQSPYLVPNSPSPSLQQSIQQQQQQQQQPQPPPPQKQQQQQQPPPQQQQYSQYPQGPPPYQGLTQQHMPSQGTNVGGNAIRTLRVMGPQQQQQVHLQQQMVPPNMHRPPQTLIQQQTQQFVLTQQNFSSQSGPLNQSMAGPKVNKKDVPMATTIGPRTAPGMVLARAPLQKRGPQMQPSLSPDHSAMPDNFNDIMNTVAPNVSLMQMPRFPVTANSPLNLPHSPLANPAVPQQMSPQQRVSTSAPFSPHSGQSFPSPSPNSTAPQAPNAFVSASATTTHRMSPHPVTVGVATASTPYGNVASPHGPNSPATSIHMQPLASPQPNYQSNPVQQQQQHWNTGSVGPRAGQGAPGVNNVNRIQAANPMLNAQLAGSAVLPTQPQQQQQQHHQQQQQQQHQQQQQQQLRPSLHTGFTNQPQRMVTGQQQSIRANVMPPNALVSAQRNSPVPQYPQSPQYGLNQAQQVQVANQQQQPSTTQPQPGGPNSRLIQLNVNTQSMTLAGASLANRSQAGNLVRLQPQNRNISTSDNVSSASSSVSSASSVAYSGYSNQGPATPSEARSPVGSGISPEVRQKLGAMVGARQQSHHLMASNVPSSHVVSMSSSSSVAVSSPVSSLTSTLCPPSSSLSSQLTNEDLEALELGFELQPTDPLAFSVFDGLPGDFMNSSPLSGVSTIGSSASSSLTVTSSVVQSSSVTLARSQSINSPRMMSDDPGGSTSGSASCPGGPNSGNNNNNNNNIRATNDHKTKASLLQQLLSSNTAD